MADRYIPNAIPEEYDAAFLAKELRRISNALNNPSFDKINLATLGAAPEKSEVGDIVYAEGSAWDPGSGEGLYEYTSSGFVKL